jgi:hypothetical protein
MKSFNRQTGLLAIFSTLVITLSFSETVLSVEICRPLTRNNLTRAFSYTLTRIHRLTS